jgi:hypothetical protein
MTKASDLSLNQTQFIFAQRISKEEKLNNFDTRPWTVDRLKDPIADWNKIQGLALAWILLNHLPPNLQT